ncbi:hypothetical protein CCACVL1_04416 [Corchorus capsularis]|uniref:Uncharacterized protein n=1 Tax=Corchorus capsularis TaxID=210143 RepID=A0A1R3JSW7_COCAP|nr:hypothetical protein CCACVL1_04416 [Corchorus capsularis]
MAEKLVVQLGLEVLLNSVKRRFSIFLGFSAFLTKTSDLGAAIQLIQRTLHQGQ